MKKVFNFYLSEIIGKEIFIKDRNILGKLQDLVVTTSCMKPQVFAAKINLGAYSILVNFSSLTILKENNEYIMSCKDSSNIEEKKDGTLYLSKHILNKRIIDANGKKLQRINDLEIGIISTGAYLVAGNVGIEGFFRRFKIEKPIRILLNSLGKKIPSKLVSWEEVEKVDFFKSGVKFSKVYSKLLNLHQSDIKEIIKELDLKIQTAILA
jgi:sporulation protein YlmC with PRC-barrel domain